MYLHFDSPDATQRRPAPPRAMQATTTRIHFRTRFISIVCCWAQIYLRRGHCVPARPRTFVLPLSAYIDNRALLDSIRSQLNPLLRLLARIVGLAVVLTVKEFRL